MLANTSATKNTFDQMTDPVETVLEPTEVEIEPSLEHRKRKKPTEDEEEWEEVPTDKEFRFNAKSVWLTYPKCPLDPERFLEYLDEKVRCEISMCFAKQEKHQDGSMHIHAFITFQRKVNWMGAQIFDLHEGTQNYHFHKGKTTRTRAIQGAWEYLCKDGLEPMVLKGKVDLFPSSVGYVAKKRDYDIWLQGRRMSKPPNLPWPLVAPDGSEITKPVPFNKKRHLWIYGTANSGKSLWFHDCISAFKPVYFARSGDKPFDNYTGQEIIVWDDKAVTTGILETTSNTYNQDFTLECRYHDRYFYANSCRLIIVICGKPINEYFNGAHQHDLDSMHARFQEYNLELETNQAWKLRIKPSNQ